MAPFVVEQAEALCRAGVEIAFFGVEGKGLRGYLANRVALRAKITDFRPDIIHAHYGLCGLLANLQRAVPVVTTYHGSDINTPSAFRFSRLSIWLSAFNIFVSKKTMEKARVSRNAALLPCGVDTQVFAPKDRAGCRRYFHFDNARKQVLFSSAFDNAVKNYPLAQAAVSSLENVELIELKGFTREEVSMLFSAADCALLTSHSEGSPQFVKEASACNCPVVSVEVGDVSEVIGGVRNCYIAQATAADLAARLQTVLADGRRADGRTKILENYDSKHIAQQLIRIYQHTSKR